MLFIVNSFNLCGDHCEVGWYKIMACSGAFIFCKASIQFKLKPLIAIVISVSSIKDQVVGLYQESKGPTIKET